MTASGQKRPKDDVRTESGLPPTADIEPQDRHVPFVPIVLQKSKVAGLEIFRENTTRELVADSYTLSPVTEIACAFNVKR